MWCALEYSVCTSTRDRIDTSVYETLSNTDWCDLEILSLLWIIVSRIWNSTFENIMNDVCSFLWHKSESIESSLCRHTTNNVGNNIELFRWYTNVSNGSFHGDENLDFRMRIRRSVSYLFPEWAMNLRVNENSPSLWPTISSVTNTGICCFPLWTPNVCPTKSGAIVHERDQVLIIDFLPDTLRASTFFATRISI